MMESTEVSTLTSTALGLMSIHGQMDSEDSFQCKLEHTIEDDDESLPSGSMGSAFNQLFLDTNTSGSECDDDISCVCYPSESVHEELTDIDTHSRSTRSTGTNNTYHHHHHHNIHYSDYTKHKLTSLRHLSRGKVIRNHYQSQKAAPPLLQLQQSKTDDPSLPYSNWLCTECAFLNDGRHRIQCMLCLTPKLNSKPVGMSAMNSKGTMTSTLCHQMTMDKMTKSSFPSFPLPPNTRSTETSNNGQIRSRMHSALLSPDLDPELSIPSDPEYSVNSEVTEISSLDHEQDIDTTPCIALSKIKRHRVSGSLLSKKVTLPPLHVISMKEHYHKFNNSKAPKKERTSGKSTKVNTKVLTSNGTKPHHHCHRKHSHHHHQQAIHDLNELNALNAPPPRLGFTFTRSMPTYPLSPSSNANVNRPNLLKPINNNNGSKASKLKVSKSKSRKCSKTITSMDQKSKMTSTKIQNNCQNSNVSFNPFRHGLPTQAIKYRDSNLSSTSSTKPPTYFVKRGPVPSAVPVLTTVPTVTAVPGHGRRRKKERILPMQRSRSAQPETSSTTTSSRVSRSKHASDRLDRRFSAKVSRLERYKNNKNNKTNRNANLSKRIMPVVDSPDVMPMNVVVTKQCKFGYDENEYAVESENDSIIYFNTNDEL